MCLYRLLDKTNYTFSATTFGTISLSRHGLKRLIASDFAARENFFQKKYTHAGSDYNTATSACFTHHFPFQILKHSAEKHQNAEYSAPYNI